MILWYLNALHIINDGFLACIVLFLPFIAGDLGVSLTQAGILGAMVSSLAILFSLPAGYLAGKFGGFKILLFAAFLYGVGFIGIGFAQTYFWLFPMFFLAGIGFALFHPIGFGLVTRLSKKEERGRQMGNFTAIGEVGRIGFSAALTFIIVYLGWHNTAILFGLTAIVVVIFFIFLLKNNKEHLVLEKVVEKELKISTILKNRKFLFASMANFLDFFSNSSVFIFLPFLLLHRGANPALLGTFAAAFFIGTLSGKTAIGRLVDTHGSVKVFIICQLIMAVFIVIMASSTWLPIILVCSVILGFFTKGTIPITQTMVSESAEHHGNFEKVFGVNNIISGIGLTIAPILMGFIADTFGIIIAFICMAVAATLAVIPAIFFHFTPQQTTELH